MNVTKLDCFVTKVDRRPASQTALVRNLCGAKYLEVSPEKKDVYIFVWENINVVGWFYIFLLSPAFFPFWLSESVFLWLICSIFAEGLFARRSDKPWEKATWSSPRTLLYACQSPRAAPKHVHKAASAFSGCRAKNCFVPNFVGKKWKLKAK